VYVVAVVDERADRPAVARSTPPWKTNGRAMMRSFMGGDPEAGLYEVA